MGAFPVTAHRPGCPGTRIATCILAVIALFTPLIVRGQSQGQSQNPTDSATVHGFVRDSRDRPVPAATVYLQVKNGTQTLTARTDSEGTYRFSALREGIYTLRAEMAGYGEATFGPLVLGQKEAKRIDLTLESPKASKPATASAGTVEFFDEPAFIVAGVTETTNPGGHGSDTILRTTEALAKATVSLSKEQTGSSRPVSASASPSAAAEEPLREAAEHGPGNFDANHRFGKVLVDDGKAREALPYLERASQLNPGDYENAYELALAYAGAGEYERARANVRSLLAQQDKAELHHLLGDVEERLGNPLEAVREYQRAAELNPSEPNLFDWGAELLMHRAVEPAIDVFTKGSRLFPRSVRMLVGLGVAWYARGSYEQAARRLCEASDLNPDDATPYLFLGKMQTVETTQSEGSVERLGRFARLQPEDALANYYYAVSLWRRRKGPEDAENLAQVESLLQKAVRLDPKFGAGYLQLGILYSERKDFPKAIPAYQKAIEASPQLAEAHYRLAHAYRLTGQRSKAQKELQLYNQISKKTAEEAERERHEIQEFVYTLQGRIFGSQPR